MHRNISGGGNSETRIYRCSGLVRKAAPPPDPDRRELVMCGLASPIVLHWGHLLPYPLRLH